jgi:hypothetical protein
VGEAAKARASFRRSVGEPSAAENDLQQVALSIPGAGKSDGLKHGSRQLDQVRAVLPVS